MTKILEVDRSSPEPRFAPTVRIGRHRFGVESRQATPAARGPWTKPGHWLASYGRDWSYCIEERWTCSCGAAGYIWCRGDDLRPRQGWYGHANAAHRREVRRQQEAVDLVLIGVCATAKMAGLVPNLDNLGQLLAAYKTLLRQAVDVR